MLVRPTGLAGRIKKVAAVDPDSPQAREAGRYDIKNFGMRNTLRRTLADWKASRDRGTLRAEYLGVNTLLTAGDRPCYTLRRTDPQPEGDEEITDATLYIDEQTWFPVGTVLKGRDGGLIGQYVYGDTEINPAFDPDQFPPAALTR